MKPITKTICVCLASVMLACVSCASSKDKNMSKGSDGTYIVNTTALCANVRGFKGATPLKVYIKNDKILKVEALPNQETSEYFNSLGGKYMQQWIGMPVSKVSSAKIDACTGATFSSNAVTENIRVACRYYTSHK